MSIYNLSVGGWIVGLFLIGVIGILIVVIKKAFRGGR